MKAFGKASEDFTPKAQSAAKCPTLATCDRSPSAISSLARSTMESPPSVNHSTCGRSSKRPPARSIHEALKMSIPTILTMSTIPPRFKYIKPVLRAALNQSLPFREIRLYIPIGYRRFPDWDGLLPKVPAGVSICRCDTDYGPATKVLAAARDLRGQDVHILFCDDDRIYDHDWHARFKREAERRPNTCIAGLGANLPDNVRSQLSNNRVPRGSRNHKAWSYKLKRILSLGLFRPRLSIQEGFIDQFHGCGGVLVKPDWFRDEAFDIPELIWTVDDVWLSGHLEFAGIPIWITEGTNPAHVRAGGVEPLTKHKEHGHDRHSANLVATNYFRTHYGIWTTSDNH